MIAENRAVGTEIVQIEGCQGATVDVETWPPIDFENMSIKMRHEVD